MDPIQEFLTRYSQELVKQIRLELLKPRTHSPGYNRDAYSQGRDGNYRVDRPISNTGGGLYNSIVANMTDNNYGFEIGMADYGYYVDAGVKPHPEYLSGQGAGGNSPFIASLMEWARNKGLPEGSAFAIRRNIWKFGIAPTNFMGQALDEVAGMIETEFGDAADKWIDILLDGFGGDGAEVEIE